MAAASRDRFCRISTCDQSFLVCRWEGHFILIQVVKETKKRKWEQSRSVLLTV